MLTLGGYINILIAFGHIVGLFWAEKMLIVTGIGEDMNELNYGKGKYKLCYRSPLSLILSYGIPGRF